MLSAYETAADWSETKALKGEVSLKCFRIGDGRRLRCAVVGRFRREGDTFFMSFA